MRRVVEAAVSVFIVTGSLVWSTTSFASPSVPIAKRCTSESRITMSERNGGGAGGQFIFQVQIANHGPKECSIGMPLGQPVTGSNRLPIGPPSRSNWGSGQKGPLVLKARTTALFDYDVVFYQIFTKAQCDPTVANGAVLSLPGIATLYFRIKGPLLRKFATCPALLCSSSVRLRSFHIASFLRVNSHPSEEERTGSGASRRIFS